MKLKLNISLFFLLTFTMSTVFAMTFTTNQSGANSSKDLTVQVGKQYQLKFNLQHQTTSNVRIQILEGVVILVDESNLIDGFHVYAFTPTLNVITLKFIREDNDNAIRDFQVDNLVYEEVVSVAQSESNHELGRKEYELTDHLRNVRAVISEKKVNGNIEVISATDYLPFGMTARCYSNGVSVRHGFNGKEKDNEGMGGGGFTYDYGFRIYNPSLGKFLSIDPLTKGYPWYTPYQFAGNTPIMAIDIDGLEEFYVFSTYYVDSKGKSFLYKVDYIHITAPVITTPGAYYPVNSKSDLSVEYTNEALTKGTLVNANSSEYLFAKSNYESNSKPASGVSKLQRSVTINFGNDEGKSKEEVRTQFNNLQDQNDKKFEVLDQMVSALVNDQSSSITVTGIASNKATNIEGQINSTTTDNNAILAQMRADAGKDAIIQYAKDMYNVTIDPARINTVSKVQDSTGTNNSDSNSANDRAINFTLNNKTNQ